MVGTGEVIVENVRDLRFYPPWSWLAYFVDADRRHKTAGSETKDSLLLRAIAVARISALTLRAIVPLRRSRFIDFSLSHCCHLPVASRCFLWTMTIHFPQHNQIMSHPGFSSPWPAL